jgi:hypothetical protein
MRNGELTALQRQALEHVQRARSQGMTLSDYARAQGISVRQVYDAAAQLRRKGLLPVAPAAAKQKFVALKVMAPSARCVCRIVGAGGALIECLEWPPAAWLATLAASAPDAT